MGKILIVDDNKDVLEALRYLLEEDFEVSTEGSPKSLVSLVTREEFEVVLLDMNFAVGINTGNEGLFWLKEILAIKPETVVILMTAYGNVDLAVKAIKEGATDFVLKPWDNDKMLSTLQAALKLSQSNREVKRLKQQSKDVSNQQLSQAKFIVGESKVMQELYLAMQKVASTEANILLTGENGTGKELIAQEIHKLSNRKEAIFSLVDLNSLSESVFESELFGHKKGAFTDAKTDRVGRFESASGGTLFLDEIGNLSLQLQAKLLTALQTRTIVAMGSNESIPIDFRLICATNKNVPLMVEEGTFREDLFYRINTIVMEVPPLREREEDIIPLSNHFLRKYSGKYDKATLQFDNKAYDTLRGHRWPGNVRELQHTIEKAVIMAEDKIIDSSALQVEPRSNLKKNHLRKLADIEREAIMVALDRHKGNLTEAAKDLGITRQTIYNKMSKYGL